MGEITVSIIVPVYKVERFIERCMRSLLEQTLQSVEYIVVDDCSPDKSISIAKQIADCYPNRKVMFITHETNKGLPSARNTGLKEAHGEYVFHCDSDDYLSHNALERMYLAAKKTDSDIVWCDWFLTYEKSERYMKQPSYLTPMDALKGILSGSMKYNVWNKLVKRELYEQNDINFPSGYGMGEDMTMIRLFACSKKVLYIPEAFYHYVKTNSNAFSQTYSDRHLTELKYNVEATLGYLKDKYGDRLEMEYGFFKLDIKYPFLITCDYGKYKLWQSWYPEANKYILKNKKVSVVRRMVQLLADKRQYWLIYVYNKLVYRFIYGIIFR